MYILEVKRERVIAEMKVYGNRRIQIPTVAARAWNVKDGDRVRWIQWAPGTYMLEAVRVTKFRPMP